MIKTAIRGTCQAIRGECRTYRRNRWRRMPAMVKNAMLFGLVHTVKRTGSFHLQCLPGLHGSRRPSLIGNNGMGRWAVLASFWILSSRIIVTGQLRFLSEIPGFRAPSHQRLRRAADYAGPTIRLRVGQIGRTQILAGSANSSSTFTVGMRVTLN